MKRGRPFNLERLAEVDNYTKKGLKPKEIARLLGITRQAIEYYQKRLSTINLHSKEK